MSISAPKKSLAARATEEEENGYEHSDVHATDEKKKNKKQSKETRDNDLSSDDEDHKEVNIFSETTVEGKRKRFTPVAEGQCSSWLLKHFVAQEGVFLKSGAMYDTYLEHCVGSNTPAVESWFFFKVLTETFPKGFTTEKDSPYFDSLPVKKKKNENKKKENSDPASQIKLADVIKEAITDLGNPRKGIRYGQMRNYIGGKYPVLHVLDGNAERLKKAVLREVYYAHIECVRGVGMCGFYRLPRTAEQEKQELEEEEKEREIEKKKKLAEKNGTDAAAGDQEGGDATADEDSAEKAEEKGQGDGEKEKKKKKKSKNKKQKKRIVVHGEPIRIEDTFALGMTYNCEPKEASVSKIRKYICDYYSSNLDPEKLRVCLEHGEQSGYWMRVAGSSSLTGTYRLTIEEFDPSADKDLSGQVMNAIVACTEPKSSSALLLKKYVMDYHENFKVDKRPDLFRKALERAELNQQIVRLSGIGGSGSFRLVKPFTPSPTVLQGDDTEGDYAHLLEDDDKTDNKQSMTVESFRDAYKPRPSKRHARPNATHIEMLDPSLPNPRSSKPHSANKKRPAAKSAPSAAKQRKVSYAEESDESSSDEESEDDDDDEPRRKKASKAGRGRPSKTSPAKVSHKKKPPSKAAAVKSKAAVTNKVAPAAGKSKKGRPAAAAAAAVKSKTSPAKSHKKVVTPPPAAASKGKRRSEATAAAPASGGREKRAAANAGELSRRESVVDYSSDEVEGDSDDERDVIKSGKKGRGRPSMVQVSSGKSGGKKGSKKGKKK